MVQPGERFELLLSVILSFLGEKSFLFGYYSNLHTNSSIQLELTGSFGLNQTTHKNNLFTNSYENNKMFPILHYCYFSSGVHDGYAVNSEGKDSALPNYFFAWPG